MPSLRQSQKTVLVTGAAGFIGSHLVDSLLAQGHSVVALDNFNPFYNPAAKRRNIAAHLKHANYTLVEGDLRDEACLDRVFQSSEFDLVVHLAAMAGVRPSLERPALYMDVNVLGSQRLIDKALQFCPKARLVFGSSSSVYGARHGESFKETDRVDQPLSPYGASKAACELLCRAAHHTRGLQVVCLRFFTVFGPRQRPDLAIRKFCELIGSGKPVEVYGDGGSSRDYTYVADIVDGVLRACSYDLPGFDIINLGRSDPVVLSEMILQLEQALGRKANIVYRSVQTGDMPYTCASIEKARKVLGYEPKTDFATGISEFVVWYKSERVLGA